MSGDVAKPDGTRDERIRGTTKVGEISGGGDTGKEVEMIYMGM